MSNPNNESSSFDGDAGPPLPNFSVSNIELNTVAPALGVPMARRQQQQQPDYLKYDTKGRGVMTTMFANTGSAYLLGIGGGGLYGLREGLANTPSSRFKVKLNSVLNHCGRHGSRAGNVFGVISIMYSLYEGGADNLELDRYVGHSASVPAFAAFMTGSTFKAMAGPRVAALAGTIGLGAVGVTYGVYSVLGIPHGSYGFLFL